MLKAVGFLNAQGQPTERYFQFLDASQSRRVLGEGIKEAYSDLFEVNTRAQTMAVGEVKNKLKTLTQGQFSDGVLAHMARTFKALSDKADFGPATSKPDVAPPADAHPVEPEPEQPALVAPSSASGQGISFDGLVYNIQLVLPESRDPTVYDALFESLRRHLGK